MTLSTHVRRTGAAALTGLVAGVLAVPALTAPASAAPSAPETGCAAYSAPTTLDSTETGAIPGPDNLLETSIEVTDPGRIAWVRVHTEIDHAIRLGPVRHLGDAVRDRAHADEVQRQRPR